MHISKTDLRSNMLPKTSQRRALTALHVNAMTSQTFSSTNGKPTRKRGIDEVDDLEPPPRAIRVRIDLQRAAGPGDRASQPSQQIGLRQNTSSAQPNFTRANAARQLILESDVEKMSGSIASLSMVRYHGTKSEPVSLQAATQKELTGRQRHVLWLLLRTRLAYWQLETGQYKVPWNRLRLPERFPDLPIFLRYLADRPPRLRFFDTTLSHPAIPSNLDLDLHRQIDSPRRPPPALSHEDPKGDKIRSSDETPGTPRLQAEDAPPTILGSPQNPESSPDSPKKERRSRDSTVEMEVASYLLDLGYQRG